MLGPACLPECFSHAVIFHFIFECFGSVSFFWSIIIISYPPCYSFLFLILYKQTNIYKCKLGKPIYSCLLSPQGKFLADFFIIELSDRYLIEIHEKKESEKKNNNSFTQQANL